MLSIVLNLLGLLSVAVLVTLVVGTAITDLRWRKIPNRATYTGLIAALGISAMVSVLVCGEQLQHEQLGLIGFYDSLTGAIACFCVMLIPYTLCRTGGAGDVKLACAIGAFLGVQGGISVLLWCYSLAALAAIAWIVWQLGFLHCIRIAWQVPGRLLFPFLATAPDAALQRALQAKMPLGGFFALGTVFTLLGGTLL